MEFSAIWESLNEKCWPLLDAVKLSSFFEDRNIPPILFPLGIVLLILVLLFAFSGGGAKEPDLFCGDEICTGNETFSDCPEDCQMPKVEGKTVTVQLNRIPQCEITVTLYNQGGSIISAQRSSSESSFKFIAVDEESAYAEIIGKSAQPQKSPSQSLKGADPTIKVTLAADICTDPAPPKGTLRLSVRDADTNAPLNGVSISIAEVQSGRALAPNAINGQLVNGQYDFALPAGKSYAVFAEKAGYAAYGSVNEPVTVAASSIASLTASLHPMSEAAGDIEVCARSNNQPVASGIVNIQDVSGEFMQTGDVSEADPVTEPSGAGCYVFTKIPSGKTLTVSMPSPPAGCVPASSPAVTVNTAGRQMVYIDLNCNLTGAGYLKVRVLAAGVPITQNATITVWTSDSSLIPGTSVAGALATGSGGYSEEVTVPANTSLYVWARGLSFGYLDYKSDPLTVAAGQHRSVDLNLDSRPASRPSAVMPANITLITFSGVAVPRAVSINQSFIATVSRIAYGPTDITPENAEVLASLGGYDCAVSQDSLWRINCTAPAAKGSYQLIIKAAYEGRYGDYKLPVDVREYAAGAGLVTITPVFSTYGAPPLTLYYDIKFNGTPVTDIALANFSLTYTDSPNAYPGTMQGFNESEAYWKAVADVPYKGEYQAEIYAEVLNSGVFYNATYVMGFTATEHSKKLKAEAYLSKWLLTPNEQFTIDVILTFGSKVAYGLEVFDVFMQPVFYNLGWDGARQSYTESILTPSEESCNLKLRVIINGAELEGIDKRVHVIDTAKQKSASCPLDRQGSCGSIGDARACVNNAKTGVAPYEESSLVACISSGCSISIPESCPFPNKGDLEPDCRLNEVDQEYFSQMLTTIQSQSERNKYAQCMDMDNDGDVDSGDQTCLTRLISGKWYGDTASSPLDRSCSPRMNGGFCFDIDTGGALPGDIYDPADGNIGQDDIDVMEGIIAAIRAGVTPAQDILDVADFNRDGMIGQADLDCMKNFMAVDFTTGYALETEASTIPEECIAIFDLQCRGSKGDLNGDGVISELDFAIENLFVIGQLAVPEDVRDCADVNDDGLINEDDQQCMEYYFTGEREGWMVCLDCDENMPEEAYSAMEICGDGFDNNCDGLKDRDDPNCECGSNTPCAMRFDTDGGSSPGIEDGNYKLCRDASWDQSGYKWFTESEIECKEERQCDKMSCRSSNGSLTYVCTSTDGSNGKWFPSKEFDKIASPEAYPLLETCSKLCDDGWDNDCSDGDASCGCGSCPYVYSYNGTSYVLDHEAYSFSVSSVLENTSHETLENLRPADGKLRLKLSEERPETSYTNYLKLLSVSHPAGTRVMPDQSGQLHTVRNLVAPKSCASDISKDCLSLVSKADGVGWVADLTRIDVSELEDVQNRAVLEFPASESAEVKLVYRARESGLITFMENELYKIAGGNNIETLIGLSYSAQIGTSFDLDTSLIHFSVWDGSDWVEQEAKYVGDARWSWNLAPIKVTPRVPIRIRVTELVGSFPLDFAGIDYSADEKVIATELLPVSAKDQSGKDVLDSILSDDDQYLKETPGDVTYIEFEEPSGIAATPDSERSYVVVSGGYYIPDLPEKLLTLDKLLLITYLISDDKTLLGYALPAYLSGDC